MLEALEYVASKLPYAPVPASQLVRLAYPEGEPTRSQVEAVRRAVKSLAGEGLVNVSYESEPPFRMQVCLKIPAPVFSPAQPLDAAAVKAKMNLRTEVARQTGRSPSLEEAIEFMADKADTELLESEFKDDDS